MTMSASCAVSLARHSAHSKQANLALDYAQTNRHGMPTYDYASVSKVEMLQPRWRALCTLPWCNEVFPGEDYGLEADGEFPSFQAKKVHLNDNGSYHKCRSAQRLTLEQKAKQFAAKQALMFLHGSPVEPIAKPSPPTSPPNKRIKTEDGSINSDDEGPGIYEQVAALASQLGFECPHYRIVKDEDHPNFWKGQPYFKQDARIPDDLGCVRGMLGKKAAKREMAEQILVWMLAQEQERHELTNELLKDLGKVKTEE